MKNILYFGPYKYNNNLGICSRNIIRILERINNINLYTKHIFFNNPYENKTIVNCEKKGNLDSISFDKFDIIIQHAPLYMLYADKTLADCNVCMPIMDYTIDINRLNDLRGFDQVIVDDPTHSKVLQEISIEHKLLDYELEIKSNIDYNFNFTYHNFNKKFYYIGKYKTEFNMIQKIIIAFLLAFRSDHNTSLILMLTDEDTESTKKSINELLENIYPRIGYRTNLPQIKFLVNQIDYDKLHALHQFGDYHISLYENYDGSLNMQLAELYNKPIIDINSVQYINVPHVETPDQYKNQISLKYSVLTSSLIEVMKNIVCEKTPKISYRKQSLKEILCL